MQITAKDWVSGWRAKQAAQDERPACLSLPNPTRKQQRAEFFVCGGKNQKRALTGREHADAEREEEPKAARGREAAQQAESRQWEAEKQACEDAATLARLEANVVVAQAGLRSARERKVQGVPAAPTEPPRPARGLFKSDNNIGVDMAILASI